jgi:tetratricopeptide (TPR) repeat protein
MPQNRLDILQNLVAQNPSDSFSRYGLAMEYVKSGALDQAMAEFQTLLAGNPDYAAAYFHGAQTLEKLGRLDEARSFYQRGIEVCTRIGDLHTRSELQAALDLLG